MYICADDYGISEKSNELIEKCLEKGILNKISVLPNGIISNLDRLLTESSADFALHINLVEGYPISRAEDVDLLITKDGTFKYSFIGLLLRSILPNRKKFKQQIYTEIQSQLKFWKKAIGDKKKIIIDSHQHTYMIPMIFKTLLDVIKDENIEVEYLRFPAEPFLPFILSPSLYLSYSPVGLVKQWLLKFLGLANRKELKKSPIKTAYFMGVMFSGHLTENKLKTLLKQYLSLAKKHGRSIEIGLHPGTSDQKDCLMKGSRKSFEKFYFSNGRDAEFNTLMNLELNKYTKEGLKNAIH